MYVVLKREREKGIEINQVVLHIMLYIIDYIQCWWLAYNFILIRKFKAKV